MYLNIQNIYLFYLLNYYPYFFFFVFCVFYSHAPLMARARKPLIVFVCFTSRIICAAFCYQVSAALKNTFAYIVIYNNNI